MKPSRLAAYLLFAAVGGAWLASASGVIWQARTPRAAAVPAPDVRLDALAADVQSQTTRLRARLANAPAPSPADRNPFTFGSGPDAPRAAARAPLPVVNAPAVPDVREPSLELIGVAETRTAAGIARTAMIAGGHDELIMAAVGQRVLDRYEVVAVGADAVELKDLESGAIRRLALK